MGTSGIPSSGWQWSVCNPSVLQEIERISGARQPASLANGLRETMSQQDGEQEEKASSACYTNKLSAFHPQILWPKEWTPASCPPTSTHVVHAPKSTHTRVNKGYLQKVAIINPVSILIPQLTQTGSIPNTLSRHLCPSASQEQWRPGVGTVEPQGCY